MARDLRNSFCAGLFLSRDESEQPVYVDRRAAYQISNFAGRTRNYGTELLGTWRKTPFTVTGTAVLSSTRTRVHDISGGMGHGIHWKAVSIAEVANFVQNWTDRPVVEGKDKRLGPRTRR